MEPAQKCLWSIQAGQRFDRISRRVEHVMNTVAGYGALDFAAVTEVDRDHGNGTHGLPVKHKPFAQNRGDFRVRIEHRAEEATVCATQLVGEFAEQSQREDWLAGFPRGLLRFLQISVPVQTRDVTVLL